MRDHVSDVNTMVNLLYGTTTPAPTTPASTPVTAGTTTRPQGGTALTPNPPVPASPPRTMSAIDADLYGADYVPLPLGADAALHDKLYSVSTSSREGLRQVQEMLSDVGFDTARRQQFNRDHAAMVQTSRLDAYTAGSLLAAAHAQTLMAQKRGTVPDVAQLQQHEETFRRELRTRFGRERAEDILTGVVEWLEDNPAVRKVLELPGFGATPAGQQFMESLVAHVQRTEHL